MRRAFCTLSIFILILAALFPHTPTQAQNQGVSDGCFKQEECGRAPYQNSFAVFSKECDLSSKPFSYYCISKPPPVKLSVPLGGYSEISGLQNYIVTIYKLLIGSAGILAGVMITIAGFEWLTAAGDSTKIKHAKGRITNALIGLVLALGSYTILYTVNPALVALQLAPIKIMRQAPVSGGVWDTCNTDADCLPLVMNQVACGYSTDSKLTVKSERTCQREGAETIGTCFVKPKEICAIEGYSCTNRLQTITLAVTAAAAAAVAIPATIGAVVGGTTAAVTGAAIGIGQVGAGKVLAAATTAIAVGVTEATKSGGFDAAFACGKGTVCKEDGKLTGAQDDTTFDPVKYTCQPSIIQDMCIKHLQCPTGAKCFHKLLDGPGTCLSDDRYQKKALGGECQYHEDCTTNRCSGMKCIGTTRDTKLAAGSACTSPQDCQDGFCVGTYRGENHQDNIRNGECQQAAKDTDNPQENNRNIIKIVDGGRCEAAKQCITGTTCKIAPSEGLNFYHTCQR